MTDEPDDTTARLMLAWMNDAGHKVHLEPCGDGWRASCEHGGHRYVAIRPTKLNALSAIAETMGFDLEG